MLVRVWRVLALVLALVLPEQLAAARGGPLRSDAAGRRSSSAVADSWLVHVQTSEAGCARMRAAVQAFVSRGVRAAREDGLAVHAECVAHVVGSRQLAEGAIAFAKQELLRELPELAGLALEQDQAVGAYAAAVSWGQDRLDQASLPLDRNFSPRFSGAGVNIYLLDSGINVDHVEFTGRATMLADVTGEGVTDRHGHGTHCAGIAGSRRLGVAQAASLIGIKVLKSDGKGSIAGSTINMVRGIDLAIAHHREANKPGVLSLSSGTEYSSYVLNSRVATAAQSGLIVVVAAGNEAYDACLFSPASAGGKGGVITVGSTTSTDAMSSDSNFGKCVDLFAPGSKITSTWIGKKTATKTLDGTSAASAFVAGAAALFLEANNGDSVKARAALLATSVSGRITGVGPGSPNKLLQVPRAAPAAPTVVGEPTPQPTTQRPSLSVAQPSATQMPSTYPAVGAPSVPQPAAGPSHEVNPAAPPALAGGPGAPAPQPAGRNVTSTTDRHASVGVGVSAGVIGGTILFALLVALAAARARRARASPLDGPDTALTGIAFGLVLWFALGLGIGAALVQRWLVVRTNNSSESCVLAGIGLLHTSVELSCASNAVDLWSLVFPDSGNLSASLPLFGSMLGAKGVGAGIAVATWQSLLLETDLSVLLASLLPSQPGLVLVANCSNVSSALTSFLTAGAVQALSVPTKPPTDARRELVVAASVSPAAAAEEAAEDETVAEVAAAVEEGLATEEAAEVEVEVEAAAEVASAALADALAAQPCDIGALDMQQQSGLTSRRRGCVYYESLGGSGRQPAVQDSAPLEIQHDSALLASEQGVVAQETTVSQPSRVLLSATRGSARGSTLTALSSDSALNGASTRGSGSSAVGWLAELVAGVDGELSLESHRWSRSVKRKLSAVESSVLTQVLRQAFKGMYEFLKRECNKVRDFKIIDLNSPAYNFFLELPPSRALGQCDSKTSAPERTECRDRLNDLQRQFEAWHLDEMHAVFRHKYTEDGEGADAGGDGDDADAQYAATYDHGDYSTAGAWPERWTSSSDSPPSGGTSTFAAKMESLMSDYAKLVLARHAGEAKLPWEGGAARRSRPMWLCNALEVVGLLQTVDYEVSGSRENCSAEVYWRYVWRNAATLLDMVAVSLLPTGDSRVCESRALARDRADALDEIRPFSGAQRLGNSTDQWAALLAAFRKRVDRLHVVNNKVAFCEAASALGNIEFVQALHLWPVCDAASSMLDCVAKLTGERRHAAPWTPRPSTSPSELRPSISPSPTPRPTFPPSAKRPRPTVEYEGLPWRGLAGIPLGEPLLLCRSLSNSAAALKTPPCTLAQFISLRLAMPGAQQDVPLLGALRDAMLVHGAATGSAELEGKPDSIEAALGAAQSTRLVSAAFGVHASGDAAALHACQALLDARAGDKVMVQDARVYIIAGLASYGASWLLALSVILVRRGPVALLAAGLAAALSAAGAALVIAAIVSFTATEMYRRASMAVACEPGRQCWAKGSGESLAIASAAFGIAAAIAFAAAALRPTFARGSRTAAAPTIAKGSRENRSASKNSSQSSSSRKRSIDTSIELVLKLRYASELHQAPTVDEEARPHNDALNREQLRGQSSEAEAVDSTHLSVVTV
jgi:hypothetical protein